MMVLMLICALTYSAMDEAVEFILGMGGGTLLCKVDLKSAYRIVPVHPSDRHLLGIRWAGASYVDMALPFGLCSAPKLFSVVADAIGFALIQAGVPFLIHYLDDSSSSSLPPLPAQRSGCNWCCPLWPYWALTRRWRAL